MQRWPLACLACWSLISALALTGCGGGSWTSAGNMNVPRSDHTATLLGASGVVLVAGGSNGGAYLDSAELYDAATNTWTSTARMSTPRSDHEAVLLASGKVLVAGGRMGYRDLASAEMFDPATRTWSAAGTMREGRIGAMSVLLPSGKVLVAGGTRYRPLPSPESLDPLRTAELYDPATNTWAPTGSMAARRLHGTATLLPSGKVLVAGGYNDSLRPERTAELYDPETGTWTSTGSLADPRNFHAATLLPTGRVLVTGSVDDVPLASTELYDPITGTRTLGATMSSPRYLHTATLLSMRGSGTRQVLVTGGRTSETDPSVTAELYDVDQNAWTVAASMTIARRQHTATLLPDGRVLVAGGAASTAAELYVPASL